jgi:hypothetical protein
VLQLDVSNDASGGDLRRIISGLGEFDEPDGSALARDDQYETGFQGGHGKFHDFCGGSPE